MEYRKLAIFLLLVFMLSFVQSQEYLAHQQNTTLNFSITSNFANQCVLKNINTPDGVVFINQTVIDQGSFDFTVLGNNYSSLGTYCHNIFCTNGIENASGQECRDVTLSGVERNMTLIILDIFLIVGVSFIIGLLHYNYKKKNYSDSNKKLSESHNGNWGKTFIKTVGNNLMRNSFLWYYSLGWLLIIIAKDLVYNFGSLEVYTYFVLAVNIYSYGFFLVIITWIGVLIRHFQIITETINDLNLGVDR